MRSFDVSLFRDGPLENLWGAGEVQKKYSCKGRLMKKNSCTPINPKKYSCNGLNKIHAKNLITKKNSCSSKIFLPPRPITFLMVRPLPEDDMNDCITTNNKTVLRERSRSGQHFKIYEIRLFSRALLLLLLLYTSSFSLQAIKQITS